ncbi:hypothetical protein OF83DRAFT_1035350, partial [Amylostereum chailletii]
MPRAISDDVKNLLVTWYYDEKLTESKIAKRACCSIGLVSKVLRLHRQYGQVRNPFSRRTGRPPTLNNADQFWISAYIKMRPTAFLDELQGRLRAARRVDVSLATLARTLRQMDLPRKRLSKAAAEWDEELRVLWEIDMAEYNDPNLFVFIDES